MDHSLAIVYALIVSPIRRFADLSAAALAKGDSPFRALCLGIALLAVTGHYSATAKEISVTATVDRNRVALGESLTYTLVVEGEGLGSLQPTLPALGDFEVYWGGQSQRMQIENTRVTRQIIFSYTMVPKKEGELTIGPAAVKAGGKSYKTQAIKIRVAKSAPPAGGGKAKPGAASAELFAQAEVSTRRAYVGQQVIYTVRLFHAADFWLGGASYNLPSLDGFVVEHLGPQNGREYNKVFNGRSYRVWELKMALVASSAGKLNIAPLVFQCKVRDPGRRDWFGRPGVTGRRVLAAAQELEVLNTPLQGRPQHYAGAVGQYRASAALDQEKGCVNQPLLLRTVISGRGYLAGVKPPQAKWPKSARVYEPKKEVRQRKDDRGFYGEVVFETVLVPKIEGKLTIPAQEFSYFDPDKGKYIKARTGPMVIEVAAAVRVVERGSFAKREVELLGGDIRFIKMTLGAYPAPALLGIQSLAVLSLPPLLYFVLFLLLRHWRRLRFDLAYSRRSRAFKRAHVSLMALGGSSAEEEASAVHGALAGYVADRLNLHRGLTSADVLRALRGKAVEGKLLSQAEELLIDCDSVRFSADKGKARELVARAGKLIEKMEKARL